MYLCLNSKCKAIFDEPGNGTTYSYGSDIDGNRGIMTSDHCCGECGSEYYAEAEQCRYCAEYFDSEDGDVIAGSCFECAKNALTLETGIAYIEQPEKYYSSYYQKWIENPATELPRQFYVNYIFESDCNRVDSSLIELCKKEWLSSGYISDKRIADLRGFIFDDMQSYMEWLEEYEKTQQISADKPIQEKFSVPQPA
jgi:hypothetical protein